MSVSFTPLLTGFADTFCQQNSQDGHDFRLAMQDFGGSGMIGQEMYLSGQGLIGLGEQLIGDGDYRAGMQLIPQGAMLEEEGANFQNQDCCASDGDQQTGQVGQQLIDNGQQLIELGQWMIREGDVQQGMQLVLEGARLEQQGAQIVSRNNPVLDDASAGDGGSPSGSTGTSGSAGSSGSNGGDRAAQIAASYLGQTSSALEANPGDKLPMDPSCPSGECCANFVSAVLTEAGLLPANQHTDSVAQLQSTLESDGWTEVPLSQAKPGDVVIMQGGGISHTEMIASNGQMIGSNNISSDNQQVSYNPLSYAASHGGVVLRPPGSTGTSISSNSGSTSSSGQPVSNSGSAQAILQETAAQDGWGSGSEWQALSSVENAEAGFNPTAENPSSGALGIAQALGHGNANTVGTLGNQYGGYGLTDAQAKAANSGNAADQALWMVNYIKSTYGTPEAAWAHEQADHWY